MADATEDDVLVLDADEQDHLVKVLDELDRIRGENARLLRQVRDLLVKEQLLGMAEGVLAKADEVVTAHHASACTPALVARLECGIMRFRAVKAKDLPPAGVVS